MTQDVNKLKIETLALASREELVELCKRLELPTKGPRTLLIGQVEEVLNSQNKAWGKIKRSLRRSGLTSKPNLKTTNFQDGDNENVDLCQRSHNCCFGKCPSDFDPDGTERWTWLRIGNLGFQPL